MARSHGLSCRAYLGGRDISADVGEIRLDPTAQVHERTTFNDAGWRTFDAGLLGWEASFDGFYDPAAGGFGRQLETALGSDTAGQVVLSVYEGDANAIGDTGFLTSDGVLTLRDQPQSVAELIPLRGTLKGNGRAGYRAILLHPSGEETVTGVESSHNHGGSSANGGRGNLHITAISGTWTIKIQHSTNDADWSDLITFTQATAVGGESVAVTGTVNQYLRVTSTEDLAGSVTFTCGFARY